MFLIRIVGWLLVAGGIIGALAGLIFTPNAPGDPMLRVPAAIAGLSVAVRGLLTVVAAEVIRLLLDIRARLDHLDRGAAETA